MHNQIEGTNFERTSAILTGIASSEIAASDTMSKFHKLTRIFWTGVALMGAMWVGHLATSNRVITQNSMSSVAQEMMETSLPEAGAEVYAQGLGKYHWHAECPLASAKSRRPDGAKSTIHRTAMTVMQAEQQQLQPCLYCIDMKS